jgi:hypothetical protein
LAFVNATLLSSLSFENAVRYANLTRLIGIGRRVVMCMLTIPADIHYPIMGAFAGRSARS